MSDDDIKKFVRTRTIGSLLGSVVVSAGEMLGQSKLSQAGLLIHLAAHNRPDCQMCLMAVKAAEQSQSAPSRKTRRKSK